MPGSKLGLSATCCHLARRSRFGMTRAAHGGSGRSGAEASRSSPGVSDICAAIAEEVPLFGLTSSLETPF